MSAIGRTTDAVISAVLFSAVILAGCGNEARSKKTQPAASATRVDSVSAGPPRLVAAQRISGSGSRIGITATFHDDAGLANIVQLFAVVNIPSRGVDGTKGCAVWCKPETGDLYLLDDVGKNWLGPKKLGANDAIRNGQCQISAKDSSVADSQGNLRWVVAIEFMPPFRGQKDIYAKAVDRQNRESNFSLLGSWNVVTQ